jgi:hypothetical protein
MRRFGSALRRCSGVSAEYKEHPAARTSGGCAVRDRVPTVSAPGRGPVASQSQRRFVRTQDGSEHGTLRRSRPGGSGWEYLAQLLVVPQVEGDHATVSASGTMTSTTLAGLFGIRHLRKGFTTQCFPLGGMKT